MTIVVAKDEARPVVFEKKVDDVVGEVPETGSMVNYIGDAMKLERGPQAFLNGVQEKYVIEPHFHEVDQFQIFVRGNARIGKHALGPIGIHYVDAYTPYGPIDGEDDGYDFFNLRPSGSLGARWMPKERERLLRRAGRHRTANVDRHELESAGNAVRTVVIEPEEDGLLAYDTYAGPGRQLPDDIAAGGGCYELVVGGSLEVDDKELPERSLIFAGPGEKLPRRRAGAGGVQVLTLQSPATFQAAST